MPVRTLLVSVLSLVLADQSQAQLVFCNKTSSDVKVAVIARDTEKAKGWYVYAPGECANAIAGPLRHRYQYYFAEYSAGQWRGDGSFKWCVTNKAFERGSNDCKPDDRWIDFRQVDIGNSSKHKISFTDSTTINFSTATNLDQACEVLRSNLERPRLRAVPIVLGSYTDPLTLPQSRTECTNVYDTGVPDLATCTTQYDECASKWEGPFNTWGCVPGTTTRCSNVKACNTWKTEIRTMECDLVLQLKLPNYIEKPVSQFIDNSFEVLDSARQFAQNSLPLMCAPGYTGGDGDVTRAIAERIAEELKERVRRAIEEEARKWLTETLIKTVAASIPSGGAGGAAMLSTELAQFIHRVYRVVEPIVRVANDAKEFAEDLGFSTSCGWSNWRRL